MEVKRYKEKVCKLSGKVWKQYNSLQKCVCDKCKEANPPKRIEYKPKPKTTLKKAYSIPKESKKRIVEKSKYLVLRKEFLAKPENRICPIKGTPTTDVHHKKGRTGYADDWARSNGITLYLDIRFWVGLSREGHKFVEENPEWAKENGYSLNRLDK